MTTSELCLAAADALRKTDPTHPKRQKRLAVADQLELQALVGPEEYDAAAGKLAQAILRAVPA